MGPNPSIKTCRHGMSVASRTFKNVFEVPKPLIKIYPLGTCLKMPRVFREGVWKIGPCPT